MRKAEHTHDAIGMAKSRKTHSCHSTAPRAPEQLHLPPYSSRALVFFNDEWSALFRSPKCLLDFPRSSHPRSPAKIQRLRWSQWQTGKTEMIGGGNDGWTDGRTDGRTNLHRRHRRDQDQVEQLSDTSLLHACRQEKTPSSLILNKSTRTLQVTPEELPPLKGINDQN